MISQKSAKLPLQVKEVMENAFVVKLLLPNY